LAICSEMLDDEQEDQRHHQGIDGDCLGKGDADEHVGLDIPCSIRVAADRLQRAPGQNTNPNARAKRPQANRQAGS
jgi:hypothetical protein